MKLIFLQHLLRFLLAVFIMVLSACALKETGGSSEQVPVEDSALQKKLRPDVRKMGGGNWLVIAEAAFPVQSKEGLKVIYLDEEIPDVVEAVELLIAETHHVKPRIYVTSEIAHVEYDYAPGVKHFRKKLKQVFQERETLKLDQEILLSLLKNSSKSYRILVVKTRTALPYSSVFMEMGSGYWSTESESALRDALDKKSATAEKPSSL